MSSETTTAEFSGRQYLSGWREAERYTGLSYETLTRMAARKLFRVYRPSPRRVLIDRSELDAAIRGEAVVA